MIRLAAILSLLAGPVLANSCAPRVIILGNLAGKYSETRELHGLLADGRLMEFWANDETGTWTITATRPDGLTCIVGHGRSFERAVPTQPGEPT